MTQAETSENDRKMESREKKQKERCATGNIFGQRFVARRDDPDPFSHGRASILCCHFVLTSTFALQELLVNKRWILWLAKPNPLI
ncbi:hypothetical protein [Palleronia sp. LCG004]|uniref:hypothetical protein n=1 Tax=Palleronia sp. LCG004 TaxID=3079304 RepID=UPI002941BC70|nr:hypothetical protein [Palleronia sp. LCG004]WOI57027.1 hypothetical protein RVY76_04345 [Palleronia sp. LCG004]